MTDEELNELEQILRERSTEEFWADVMKPLNEKAADAIRELLVERGKIRDERDWALSSLASCADRMNTACREAGLTEIHSHMSLQDMHDGIDRLAHNRYAGAQREAAFRSGLRIGLRRFAWWKDGEQFVGTCGTTLHNALAESEMKREYWECDA